jgi:hypothetical protein
VRITSASHARERDTGVTDHELALRPTGQSRWVDRIDRPECFCKTIHELGFLTRCGVNR